MAVSFFCHAQSPPSFFAASLNSQVSGRLQHFLSKAVLSVRRQLLPLGYQSAVFSSLLVKTSSERTEILKEIFGGLS